MERNQSTHDQQLSFKVNCALEAGQNRKVFDFFASLDPDTFRRNRFEVFAHPHVAGLMQVLNLNSDLLYWLDDEARVAEFVRLMQEAVCLRYRASDVVEIKENQLHILLDGTLIKKMPLASGMSLSLQAFKKGMMKPRNRASTIKKQSLSCSKVIEKVSSDSSSPPRLLPYEYLQRSFECFTEATIVKISQNAINKLEALLAVRERQQVRVFMGACLGIEQLQQINQLVPKISKKVLQSGSTMDLMGHHLYMIYRGEMLLSFSNGYQIFVNANSMIGPFANCQHCKGRVSQNDTIIICIDYRHILEHFTQLYPEKIHQVVNKIKQSNNNRMAIMKPLRSALRCNYNYNYNYFMAEPTHSPEKQQHRLEMQELEQQLIEPLISSAAFEEQLQVSDRASNKLLANLGQAESNRFRKNQSPGFYDEMLANQCGRFMGDYPYVKIIEGYNAIAKIKNIFSNIKKDQKSDQNKSSGHSGHCFNPTAQKKQYYMNKVRRLKIKNIAQRTIPNARNKTFDADSAQKQIHNNSLFPSYIEYPLKGEHSMNNAKRIQQTDSIENECHLISQINRYRQSIQMKSLMTEPTNATCRKSRVDVLRSTIAFTSHEKVFEEDGIFKSKNHDHDGDDRSKENEKSENRQNKSIKKSTKTVILSIKSNLWRNVTESSLFCEESSKMRPSVGSRNADRAVTCKGGRRSNAKLFKKSKKMKMLGHRIMTPL